MRFRETNLTPELVYFTAVRSSSSLFTATPSAWGCLQRKIHSTLLKKRSKILLISCSQHSTNGSVSLQAWGIKCMPPKSFLLTVEASSGRKVDELEKAITVAAKDPALYGIDEAELERRRRWTSNARTQVRNVKTGVLAGKGNAGVGNASEVRLELMRMPNSSEANRYDQYGGRDDDGFVQSESDRQMLLIKQQDEELDELSKSVERIGGVGLTIHDELVAQERIIDELGTEMDSTKNRLDFVQKKVGMVMKKAGAKGQMMMICFLLVLFIILFVLVFLT
ncbi:syntaxin-61 isoform X3 [Brassica rapa]|nr:syntaxin-61 isoform X3 [Brassica rapa]